MSRGGSWGSGAAYCQAANRNGRNPAYRNASGGFRLAFVRSGPAGSGPAEPAGDYAKAQDALQRTMLVNGGYWQIYQAAILEAFLVEDGLGNRDDYRMYCKRLVEIGYWSPEPGFAERAAKAALLLPGNEVKVADAVALADKASTLGRNYPEYPWFLPAKSMAKYRTGEFDSAIQSVHQFNQKETFFIILCTGDLVKAMALHRLGNRELAKKVFVDTTLSFESDWNQAGDQLQKDSVFNKLVFDIWRKECEKLLATDSP